MVSQTGYESELISAKRYTGIIKRDPVLQIVVYRRLPSLSYYTLTYEDLNRLIKNL